MFVYIDNDEEYNPEDGYPDENTSNAATEVTITEILSSTKLRIETNEEITEEIFVYGQEVNNKYFLAKDKIFTVGISALQEIDRQLQSKKEKTSILETKVPVLEGEMNNILTRLSALENSN